MYKPEEVAAEILETFPKLLRKTIEKFKLML